MTYNNKDIMEPHNSWAVCRDKKEKTMRQVRAESALEMPVNHRYQVRFASGPSEIRAAQRLRYQIFAEEYGARLNASEPGFDIDFYDDYCEHLIVRDQQEGAIVGTYRVLSPDAAKCLGSYYSENEFDLTRLAPLRSSIVEVGRSCVAAEHRTGSVITLLWMKLAEYMMKNNYGYLMGCASIPMQDGGHNAANLYLRLGKEHLSPFEYRVMPRSTLPYERLANDQPASMPPLIRGYLRAGAWVCGEPAWDPDFNSADLLLMLPMSKVSERYHRHFLRT